MHGTTILKYTSVCSVILNLVIARRPTWKWRVETSSVYRGQSTREAAPPRPSCGAPWTRALRLHRKEAPIPVCRPSWSARMQRLGAACFKCCLRLCRHVGSHAGARLPVWERDWTCNWSHGSSLPRGSAGHARLLFCALRTCLHHPWSLIYLRW